MTHLREAAPLKVIVFVDSKHHSAAELAALIGVAADESWDLGSPLQFGSRRKLRDTSSWVAVEMGTGDEDCYDLADRLFSRLKPLLPRFQALPEGIEVSVRILVNETNEVFGLGLSRSHVEFAAELGADIDVSVVVDCGRTPRGENP